MERLCRRQLIKGSAGGALTLGVLGAGASPVVADDDDGLHVHVHGNLQTMEQPRPL